MRPNDVPEGLRVRLGHEATAGLLELLERERGEATDQMVALATERFERRLATEMSALRVELGQSREQFTRELATARVEFIRWCFLFWVTQLTVITGVLFGYFGSR
jgi:hypothetical protein